MLRRNSELHQAISRAAESLIDRTEPVGVWDSDVVEEDLRGLFHSSHVGITGATRRPGLSLSTMNDVRRLRPLPVTGDHNAVVGFGHSEITSWTR